MYNRTMYLPGFSNLMRPSRAKAKAAQVMAQASSIDGLAALVARFVPTELFKTAEGQRNRLFTSMVTFTAFLGQVMERGSSCREAVRRVQTWFLASSQTAPDDSTSAYCQARRRLDLALLDKVFQRLCAWFEAETKRCDLWLGRTVKILDGTGISMPDTKANHHAFDYVTGQAPGCGFPTGKLVGLFNLATGHLSRFVVGNWKVHDARLARQLLDWLTPGEIVMADRGFCGWPFLACLVQKRLDVVIRLSSCKKTKAAIEHWPKPQRRPHWDPTLWRALPKTIEVRIVRYRVSEPGFRTKEVVVATTLLDTKKYPDEAIMELYARRWQVELNFRDIKTTLGLDILRGKTPDLVQKEIRMQAIAYNLVRGVMFKTARQHHRPIYQLSFKGTVDTLQQWTRLFGFTDQRTIASRWYDLLCALAADLVLPRPHRSEPRAIKRRPKPHQRLNIPRHKMIVRNARRDKKIKTASKKALS